MSTLARLALAALGGVAVYFSYEPHGLWPLAIIGVAGFSLALAPWRGAGPSAALGALIAFVHALGTFLLLLPWVGEFVGALPYIALAVSLAAYTVPMGIFGALIARRRYGLLAFPAVYLAVEWARSSFPFGGFPWARLAWGQIDGPLAALASWGGPALVTFATVLSGCGIAALIASPRRIALGAAALVAPLGLGLAAQLGVDRGGEIGQVTASAVQGNVPRMGLDFNAQRRAVLGNHVNETFALAESGAKPDIVIWPENSSDVNPFTDPEAAALIRAAVERIDAPVLVGTLTRDDVGQRNTMHVFDPETGAGDYHYKKYLQPFGEYMPMRDFFRHFSELVDLAGDFQPGNGPGVVSMGKATVGIATCYEVAVDNAYRTSIRNGATILATPTNNATFGFTDMTYQQLAMSRMRAIETDRAVVVAATSGVSAIVRPDGSVSQHTGIFEAGHLTEELPLKDTVTPAVVIGRVLEWVLVGLGVAAMAAGMLQGRSVWNNQRKES
ncbi:apolipoprotein N-acyltransferase [Corynebacterium liangguodongii]|uniref:Apolipoprotein N-acyltransferase n=1 Tax=Corynebacterium liangguodongii TaxID=2079535 RepID=A0A2S0WE97_9CORY|nr:apolipoprotein N-acyltransferase [Corynebacterium liangguodongii]AWB83992.1 apolipoprotein N-acyltransferase [Corynebacterium liangguodongii]PWC00004.1 apolipoprotein N-acyltransferase [Corynebacterium liangguodongii]